MSVIPSPIPVEAPPVPVQCVDARAQISRCGRWALWAIVLWLGAFFTWAMLAPLSGAVVAEGVVKVEANRLTVRHRDGGNVARVFVSEGQLVSRGQPLLVLEDVRVDASVDLLRSQFFAEQVRMARLSAEAALHSTWQPPEAVTGTDVARSQEAISRERASFLSRRKVVQGQLTAVRRQIDDVQGELAAHERNRSRSAEALGLLRDELVSNERLLQENFVNRTRVLTLKRGVAEYESRVEAVLAEMAKARQRRTELQARLTATTDAYVQAATDELRDSNARLVDLQQRLRSAIDTAGRHVIEAPVSGRLVDLRVNTVGSALGAREPVVDIVPADARLLVEARVSASAIGDIRPGLPVDVKLLAFPAHTVPLLAGRITLVGADALLDARTAAHYFIVQAVVNRAQSAPTNVELTPGMAAEVYIKTHERTAWQFLLEPLTSSLRRGFRER